jgi:hypothetical protein
MGRCEALRRCARNPLFAKRNSRPIMALADCADGNTVIAGFSVCDRARPRLLALPFELPAVDVGILGFTHVWGKSRLGKNVVRQVTAKNRYARALAAVTAWCRIRTRASCVRRRGLRGGRESGRSPRLRSLGKQAPDRNRQRLLHEMQVSGRKCGHGTLPRGIPRAALNSHDLMSLGR